MASKATRAGGTPCPALWVLVASLLCTLNVSSDFAAAHGSRLTGRSKATPASFASLSGGKDGEDGFLSEGELEDEDACEAQVAMEDVLKTEQAKLVDDKTEWVKLFRKLADIKDEKEICDERKHVGPVCSSTGTADSPGQWRCGGAAYLKLVDDYIKSKNCLLSLSSTRTMIQNWIGHSGDPGILGSLTEHYAKAMEYSQLDSELWYLYRDSKLLVEELLKSAEAGLSGFSSSEMKAMYYTRRRDLTALMCALAVGSPKDFGSNVTVNDNAAVIKCNLSGHDDTAFSAFTSAINTFGLFVKDILKDGGIMDRAQDLNKALQKIRFQKLQGLLMDPKESLVASDAALNLIHALPLKGHRKKAGEDEQTETRASLLESGAKTADPLPSGYIGQFLGSSAGGPAGTASPFPGNFGPMNFGFPSNVTPNSPESPNFGLPGPQTFAVPGAQNFSLPGIPSLSMPQFIGPTSFEGRQIITRSPPPAAPARPNPGGASQQARVVSGPIFFPPATGQAPGANPLLPDMPANIMPPSQSTEAPSNAPGGNQGSANTPLPVGALGPTSPGPVIPVDNSPGAPPIRKIPIPGGHTIERLAKKPCDGCGKTAKDKIRAIATRLRMFKVAGNELTYECDTNAVEKAVKGGYADIGDKVITVWGGLLPQAFVATVFKFVTLSLPKPEVDLAEFYNATMKDDGSIEEGFIGELPVNSQLLVHRFSTAVDEAYQDVWLRYFNAADEIEAVLAEPKAKNADNAEVQSLGSAPADALAPFNPGVVKPHSFIANKSEPESKGSMTIVSTDAGLDVLGLQKYVDVQLLDNLTQAAVASSYSPMLPGVFPAFLITAVTAVLVSGY